MSETLLMIFEIIGTVAFSVSGAMVGIAKKMDIFGIVILGLTTAVGGGVIRDVVLGITPPITFVNPVYAAIAVVTAIVVFLPSVRRIITKSPAYYEKVLLLMDSIGLGVFTAVGIRTAYGASYETADANNIFLLIFVGLVTSVGGGVLRDIMAGDRPYIFVKHFYASASLIGAVICSLMWGYFGQTISMTAGTAVVITLRLCAARFRWSLPKPD